MSQHLSMTRSNGLASMVKQMTLEEKVGQMAQITLDAIGNGESVFSSKIPFAIDTNRLKEAGDIFGVRVLDHIIIGDSFLSFVQMGLL